jgi:hypothetical protein
MESALDTLRTALADGATAEQRAAGITTCRAMLAALEASPGQPLPVASPAAATPSSGMPTSLAGLTLDQVLDLAIGKMRSMLPPDKLADTQPNQPPLAIQLFRGTS